MLVFSNPRSKGIWERGRVDFIKLSPLPRCLWTVTRCPNRVLCVLSRWSPWLLLIGIVNSSIRSLVFLSALPQRLLRWAGGCPNTISCLSSCESLDTNFCLTIFSWNGLTEYAPCLLPLFLKGGGLSSLLLSHSIGTHLHHWLCTLSLSPLASVISPP